MTLADWEWTSARAATVHCLIGCSIGELVGMTVGQSAGWSTLGTLVLSVALAFVFGILLASLRISRLGLTTRRAVRIAAAAEVVSITSMEVVANALLLLIPGAFDAGPGTVTFWAAMAFSLALAFVATVPVNAWLISRGRGHALVPHNHAAHHASG